MPEEITPETLGLDALSNADQSSNDQETPTIPDDSLNAGQEENAEEASTPTENIEGEKRKEEPEVKPYTDDEFKLASLEGDVDTKRLTPLQDSALKASKAWYTKKTQELAEERRVITEKEKYLKDQELRVKDPKELEYREYKQNPRAYFNKAQSIISSLRADPYNEENAVKISQINDLIRDFEYRYQDDRKIEAENFEIVNRTQLEINESIPNFKEVSPKLRDFVVSKGIPGEDIGLLTDAIFWNMVEKAGIKNASRIPVLLTKFIHNIYSFSNAKNIAEKKVDKTTQPLGRAGKSTGKNENKNELEDLSYEEYVKKRRAQLKKGG